MILLYISLKVAEVSLSESGPLVPYGLTSHSGQHGYLIYTRLTVHKKYKSNDIRQHQFQLGKKRMPTMDGIFGKRILSAYRSLRLFLNSFRG